MESGAKEKGSANKDWDKLKSRGKARDRRKKERTESMEDKSQAQWNQWESNGISG